MEFRVEQSGERLDKYMAAKLTSVSRTRLQRLIKDGAVKVNGHFVTKPSFTLRPNDRVILLEEKVISPQKEFTVEPEPDIPLEIVYEDDDVLVVNKPAGIITHPAINEPNHTLANALVARYPNLVGVGESPLRPGIVHRLDKGTSGLLIVAKNQEAFLFIKKQFLDREVKKKYLALVEGVPEEREGVIDFDIRPSKQHRLKRVAIRPRTDITYGGSLAPTDADETLKKRSVRAAKTLYKTRQTFGDKYALLEVAPQTGRTHQIRVHLSAIGHPVAGDRLYGSRSKLLRRQFLHAYSLEFTAPSGKPISLEIGLPKDLEEALREAETTVGN